MTVLTLGMTVLTLGMTVLTLGMTVLTLGMPGARRSVRRLGARDLGASPVAHPGPARRV
jgi:hypothetical protein